MIDETISEEHVCNTCRREYGFPQITFAERKLKACALCGDIEFGDVIPCVLNDWMVFKPAIIVEPIEEETQPHDQTLSTTKSGEWPMNVPQAWIEWARAIVLRALPPDVPKGMVEVIATYRRTEPNKDTNSYDGVSSQQG